MRNQSFYAQATPHVLRFTLKTVLRATKGGSEGNERGRQAEAKANQGEEDDGRKGGERESETEVKIG